MFVSLSPRPPSNNVEATLSNATSQPILWTKNGNNVAATLDVVEMTKLYDELLRHCCRFWQQSGTLLRHCCWSGRGLVIMPQTLNALNAYRQLFV